MYAAVPVHGGGTLGTAGNPALRARSHCRQTVDLLHVACLQLAECRCFQGISQLGRARHPGVRRLAVSCQPTRLRMVWPPSLGLRSAFIYPSKEANRRRASEPWWASCSGGRFGGPYGRVKEGLLDIAQATGALLVPVTIRGRRIVRLNRPITHYVPLPFCSLVVHNGEPLDAQRLSTMQCQETIDRLEQQHAS